LLAKAVCQPTSVLDVPTSSRAGSLPHGVWGVHKNTCPTQNYCGSELARESGVSVNISAGRADVFASRLAPTGRGMCLGSVRADDFAGRQVADDAGVFAPAEVAAEDQVELSAEVLLDANPRARRRAALGVG